MYCDSDELERNWFHWILGTASPDLELYRKNGLLWTKIIGVAKHSGETILKRGKPLPDPSYPERLHCLAFADPIYFKTDDGDPQDVDWDAILEILVSQAFSLESDSRLHLLDNPFEQLLNVIPHLEEEGYIREQPTESSWHAMLRDVRNICDGISTRFNLPNEDEQQELASKAFVQVLEKLVSGRLIYMPGRAPVFNLLTTTTYRVMYSILNKQTHQRQGIRQLLDDAAAGVLPSNAGRSIRVPQLPKRAI